MLFGVQSQKLKNFVFGMFKTTFVDEEVILENLSLQLTMQIFKMYPLNFGPKMLEKEDFCLSFELFPFSEFPEKGSDFLSSGVLEFFSGLHKKACCMYIANCTTFFLYENLLFTKFGHHIFSAQWFFR